MTNPYATTTLRGKKIAVHRKVMAKVVGRDLETKEYVHHKNLNKRDNRPENLEIKSPVEHGRLHHLRYPLTKKCAICGQEFTPHKTKRKRKQTCSLKCRYELMARKQRALTPDQESEIRRRIADGETGKSLAKTFGVAASTVSKVRRKCADG